MDTIDIKNMKRNPKFMDKNTKTIKGNVIATTDVYYLFPDKFIDKHLSVIDMASDLLGVMAICTDTEYAVLNVPCRLKVSPTEVADVVIDDVLYKKVSIEEGGLIFDSLQYVKKGDLVYELYEYLYLQGKVPWYLEYEDLFTLFSRIPEYTGTSVGKDPLVFEIVTAVISRSETDLNKSYRNSIKSKADIKKHKARYIGLMNIYYSFKSTLAKIAGSYMKEGVLSAMVNEKQKEPTEVEKLIKG